MGISWDVSPISREPIFFAEFKTILLDKEISGGNIFTFYN